MKIALITSSFFPTVGGAEIATHNIALQLMEQGHCVDVIVPYQARKFTAQKMTYNIIGLLPKTKEIAFSHVALGRVLLAMQLVYLQIFNKYDVWHTNFPGYFIAGLQWMTKYVPVVLTTQGQDIQKHAELQYGWRLHEAYENLLKTSLHHFNYITALSKSVQDDFYDLNPELAHIDIVPNGVDIRRFKNDIPKDELRRIYDLPHDMPVILTTGRNHPKKGFKHIPKIASLLKQQGVKFRWLIVGKGNDELLALAEKYSVAELLDIRGQIGSSRDENNLFQYPSDDLIKLYYAADIYCFPSLLETFGIVMVEAMAAGLPVVTTNAPGCRDVVENRQTGIVISLDSIELMADAIAQLITDKAFYDRLSKNALTIVQQKYDWKTVAEMYQDIYNKAISGFKC
ncbi:glycosyltransferase family 4 protein [candidate division KSB1 bacterium]|nr:glycosyltransferase family 4 protein [candidate division KSB1 bacterium]